MALTSRQWRPVDQMPIGEVVEVLTGTGLSLYGYRLPSQVVTRTELGNARIRASVLRDGRWAANLVVVSWRPARGRVPSPPRARTRREVGVRLHDPYWEPLPGAPCWDDLKGRWV